MAEHVLALRALADLLEIVVALVGENVFAQFQHDVLQARRAAAGGGEDGVDDRLVAGAAADVAGDRLHDFGAARGGIAIEQRLGSHQHARRAIAALGGKILGRSASAADAVGSLLQAIQRLDGAAGHGLGQRQAGEMRLAVDQHAAGAAAALAAAEFRRHVADQFAQRDEQVGAAIDENARHRCRCDEIAGRSWPYDLFLTREQTTQMDADDLAAVPGAAERVVGRRCSFRGGSGCGARAVAASSARPSRARSAAGARICVGAIDPNAIRAPATRPPLIGRCAASVMTEPPLGLIRAILR